MSQNILITLADEIVEVNCLYPQTVTFLSPYRTGKDPAGRAPSIRVNIRPEELIEEQKKSDLARDKEGEPRRDFHPEYLEQLTVYRKIAEKMPERGVVLMHGSVIAVDGEGYLFTAKSGTGKSTHARLWREYFGERARMINDDKPLLRIEEGRVLAYGTPWDGKHHLSTNCSVPLKAICFLSRGEKNEISKIRPMEKYTLLIQQIFRPVSPDAMSRTMQLIDLLTKNVSFYDLKCNMDIEAAEVAWKGMNG